MNEQAIKDTIILINKPLNWTSFNIVSKIKSIVKQEFGIKKFKIGHAGTLDPLATGLLIICSGKNTKQIEQFQTLEKEYTGIFKIGQTTPSFDLETNIDNSFATAHITNEIIFQVAKSFEGIQLQTPPIYSAVKVKGKRAYNYAREGKELFIEPKNIEIKQFEILKIDNLDIHFKIICSKGTYIRAIARDFGATLKTGAYLKELKRTRIGDFILENAIQIEQKCEIINYFKH